MSQRLVIGRGSFLKGRQRDIHHRRFPKGNWPVRKFRMLRTERTQCDAKLVAARPVRAIMATWFFGVAYPQDGQYHRIARSGRGVFASQPQNENTTSARWARDVLRPSPLRQRERHNLQRCHLFPVPRNCEPFPADSHSGSDRDQPERNVLE